MKKKNGNEKMNATDRKYLQELKQLNELLVKERNKAQSYLDLAGVLMVAVDKNGLVTLANKKACKVLGYTEKELIGTNWFDHYLPKYLVDEVKEVFAKLMQGEIEFAEYYENPILTKEGEERLIAWRNAIIRDDNEKIIGTLSSGTDITDSKIMEKKLHHAYKVLKVLSECNKAVVRINEDDKLMQVICNILVEIGDYRFAWVGLVENDEQKSIKEAASASRGDDSLGDITVSCTDSQTGQSPTERAVREKKLVTCRNFGEMKLCDQAMKLGYVSSIALPLFMKGNVFGVLTIFSDQSEHFEEDETSLLIQLAEDLSYGLRVIRDRNERHETEAELKKLSLAVEQSPASIVITDIEGTIEHVNPKFCELTGYSSEEAVGQNPRILKSDYHPDRVYKELWNTITSGNNWVGEFKNVKKNRETYWERALISPVLDKKGEILHYLAIKEDITEQKAAEFQIEKGSRQRGKLLEAIRKMSLSLNIESIFQVLCHEAQSFFTCHGVTVYMLDDYKKLLLPVYVVNPTHAEEIMATRVSIKHSLSGRAIKEKKGMIFNYANQQLNSFHIPGTPKDDKDHLLVSPMVSDDDVFGILALHRREIEFTTEELELADTLSLYASAIINNARAHEELLHQVEERKHAEQNAIQQLHQMERASQLMVDRELRMVALKKEINELRVKCGQSKKYRSPDEIQDG